MMLRHDVMAQAPSNATILSFLELEAVDFYGMDRNGY